MSGLGLEALDGAEWDLSPDAWDRSLAACSGATAFHSAAWLEAMHACFGATPVRARFRFRDGAQALMPLSLRRLGKGLLPLAVAGETGAYGGVLAPAPLSCERMAAVLESVRRRFGSVRVSGNPFVPAGGDRLSGAGWASLPQTTHILSLAPLETLRQGFSRGCKARGNKARRLGVEVEWLRGAPGAALFDPLYRDSVRRWGTRLTWARPRTFFEAILAMPNEVAEVAIARRAGRPVAGMLFLRHGHLVHYVAGATREDQLAACPANRLMETAIERYGNLGAHVLDLGASNGLPGVSQFKASFGARVRPYQGVESLTWPLSCFLTCRSRMPAWLAFQPVFARPEGVS